MSSLSRAVARVGRSSFARGRRRSQLRQGKAGWTAVHPDPTHGPWDSPKMVTRKSLPKLFTRPPSKLQVFEKAGVRFTHALRPPRWPPPLPARRAATAQAMAILWSLWESTRLPQSLPLIPPSCHPLILIMIPSLANSSLRAGPVALLVGKALRRAEDDA